MNIYNSEYKTNADNQKRFNISHEVFSFHIIQIHFSKSERYVNEVNH